MKTPRPWFLAALIVAAAVSRIIPHPYGFAPFTAIALFGGANSARKGSALAVTFGSLLLGDLLLHLTYLAGWQPNWGFYNGQALNYACLLPAVLVGYLLRQNRNVASLALATLVSSVSFFLLSNFNVWALGSGLTYPKTFNGLLLCYEAGIPFFKNALAGDPFYVTVLFGGLALAEAGFPSLRLAKSSPRLSTVD